MKPVVSHPKPQSIDPAQVEAVQTIADTLVDAAQGFEILKSRAEGALKPCADRFSHLHTKHLSELDASMRAKGHALDLSGTLFGKVQRAVVLMRDIFADLDREAMDALRDGEAAILERYSDALDDLSADHPAADVLSMQRGELESALAALDETLNDAA